MASPNCKADFGNDDRDALVNELKRPGIHDQHKQNMKQSNHKRTKHHTYASHRKDSRRERPENVNSLYDESEETKTHHNNRTNNRLFFGTILVVVLGLAVEFLYPHLAAEERGYWQLNRSLESMQKTFPKQNGHFWQVSQAALKPVLIQKAAKRPGVILLAGSKQFNLLSKCLAQKLSEAVKDAFEVDTPVAVFDSHEYRNLSPQSFKNQLNDTFLKQFKRGTRVGMVLSIELLSGDSPVTLYHWLCNAAHAPAKNVAIIITFNMEEETSTGNDIVLKELRRLWEPVLDKDQLELLVGCIANSVVQVQTEQHWQSYCTT